MECKLRCIDLRGVSNPGRAFRPPIGVTEIYDQWSRSTMGVIVISLGTPRSARENSEFTWEHRAVLATSLGLPRITVKQFGKNFFLGITAGAPGNQR
jgi:hypothetical protein